MTHAHDDVALTQALVQGGQVHVTVRSKDTGGRLLTYVAAVSRIRPEDPASATTRDPLPFVVGHRALRRR